MTRRLRTATLAVALSAALAGCSGGPADSGAGGGAGGEVDGGGDRGYVAGKGVITTLQVADRRTPGPLAGTTLEGRRTSLADRRGEVVVVNVWGSWCPPCRAEAPMLAAAARDLRRRGVEFLGINSRNPERAAPLAFQRRYRVPYESIYDPDGRSLLAFHGTLPPNAIPSTVVIDRQGRVAASVVGPVTRTTLYDIVEEVAGSAGGGGA